MKRNMSHNQDLENKKTSLDKNCFGYRGNKLIEKNVYNILSVHQKWSTVTSIDEYDCWELYKGCVTLPFNLINRYHDSSVNNYSKRNEFLFPWLVPKNEVNSQQTFIRIYQLNDFHSYIRQFPVFKNLLSESKAEILTTPK